VDNSSTHTADRLDTDSSDHAADLAAAALADAKKIARPLRRRRTARRQDEPTYSGPASDRRDPARAGDVLAGLVSSRGWEVTLAQARVFADWAAVVGPEIAARCRPVTLRAGELTIAAESTAWATQLRLLSATLLARVAAELGPNVVSVVRITGPAAPSWKHGPWSVRGRGPRDTYG
jgi:predicted nucleic acid-binding Zn ribbon protein